MLIIDRFEDDYAIVETSDRMLMIDRADIPTGAKEGDVLIMQVDNDSTNARKERIESKMNKLFKD